MDNIIINGNAAAAAARSAETKAAVQGRPITQRWPISTDPLVIIGID